MAKQYPQDPVSKETTKESELVEISTQQEELVSEEATKEIEPAEISTQQEELATTVHPGAVLQINSPTPTMVPVQLHQGTWPASLVFPAATDSEHAILLIGGEAASGKTTLLRGLSREGWTCLDLDSIVEPLLETAYHANSAYKETAIHATNQTLRNWLWEHCHVAHNAVGGMWLQHLPENKEQAVIGPAPKQGRSLHIG
jgi:hypothetical protein